MKLPFLPPAFGPVLLALLILAGGGVATSLVAGQTAALERQAARHALDSHLDPTLSALRGRLSDSERLLRGAAGVFAIQPSATRMDWRNYVLAEERNELPAGTNSIGFARIVTPQQLPVLTDSLRLEGFADYTVYPEGERALYAPVVYVEPSAGRTLRGLGFDILSEPARRAAAEAARDSGEARMTTRIDLIRETEVRLPQHGTALYLPIYINGAPLNTLAQRREALLGFVYVTFRLNDLLDGISSAAQRDVVFMLYEADASGRGAILGTTTIGPLTDPATLTRKPSGLQAERKLEFGGRTWILQAAALPEFEARHGFQRTQQAIIGGGLISVTLAWLVWYLARRWLRTRQRAETAERARAEAQDQLAAGFAHVTDGLLVTDTQGIVLAASAAATRMFGLSPAHLLGHGTAALMPAVSAAGAAEIAVSVETEGRDAAGMPFPLQVLRVPLPSRSAAVEPAARNRWVGQATEPKRDLQQDTAAAPAMLWVVSDLRALRKAERDSKYVGQRYATLLDHTAFCVIAFDADGLVTDINRAGQRMLWYQASDIIGKMRYTEFHDPDELAARAHELGGELGEPMKPGLGALTAKARLGMPDEREWTYLRKGGSHLPVNLVLIAMPNGAVDGEPGGYLAIAHDLTERKRADAYINHIAHHDTLTGLPNRAQLQGRSEALLQRALQNGERLALLLIDLHRFKDLNESLGHQVGDDVLRTIGDRLKAAVRQGDLVARMGGDEFAVVLGDLRHTSEAELIAAKILARLSEDLQMAGQRFRVSPSIGMALFPHDGDSLAELLKSADAAIVAAKQAGRGQVRRFSSDMAEASMARFTIESLMRRALADEAFVMRYQPIVDIATLEITGVEALVSWETPERGAMSPAEFIPIAEQSGLIVPLGEWILCRACRDIQAMRLQLGKDLNVAVNISPLHLRQETFPALITRCLAVSGLPASSLTIEVTEGILVEGTLNTIETFRRIRALGVGLSIDDFGTGYSGLSYLTRLPITKLKIDKSFVDAVAEDEYDRAVASAIITLGHQLRLTVVAEGVETVEQLDVLRVQGCDAVQGYLFSPALALPALHDLCRAGLTLADKATREKPE